jgi:hypothetical protein
LVKLGEFLLYIYHLFIHELKNKIDFFVFPIPSSSRKEETEDEEEI